jgi:prepilin-type N-terminal cleavage/methylation domain-containing protein
MRRTCTNRGTGSGGQGGFTLMELLVATVIILVGLVAVAQLVPTSVLMNSNNRNDGTALVFAQHQMEALRAQPLNATTFSDPLGVTCPLGNACNLGDPTQPGTLVGSPVNTGSGSPIIDFSVAPVNGYSFTYLDPRDPIGAGYDVRWSVITSTNGPITTGRRIILGVFRRGMRSTALPVTLDTMVSK